MSEDTTQPLSDDGAGLIHTHLDLIKARLDSIDARLTSLENKIDEFDKAEDEVFRRMFQNA